MADLINPYANPYLPSFVNQRPRVNDVKPQLNLTASSYIQIRSVNGYDGARNYAMNQLAAGASDIVAESDPNIARVYILAKDSTGQIIVEGYKLIHEDEPKPVTMDDLNAKMSELLDRMNKLEEEQNNAKPSVEPTWKTTRQQNGTGYKSNSGNGTSIQQSSSSTTDGAK